MRVHAEAANDRARLSKALIAICADYVHSGLEPGGGMPYARKAYALMTELVAAVDAGQAPPGVIDRAELAVGFARAAYYVGSFDVGMSVDVEEKRRLWEPVPLDVPLAEGLMHAAMAFILFRHGRIDESLEEGLAGLEALAQPSDDLAKQVRIDLTRGVGRAYRRQFKYETSAKFYRLGLRRARQVGSRIHEAMCLHGLAITEREMGKLKQARQTFKAAEPRLKLLGQVVFAMDAHHGACLVDMMLGQFGKAREGLEQSVTEVTIMNVAGLLRSVYVNLVEVNLGLGDFGGAHRALNALNDYFGKSPPITEARFFDLVTPLVKHDRERGRAGRSDHSARLAKAVSRLDDSLRHDMARVVRDRLALYGSVRMEKLEVQASAFRNLVAVTQALGRTLGIPIDGGDESR